MENKIIIETEEKNQMKVRLYFTYFFYNNGYNLNEKFSDEFDKRYKAYLDSINFNGDDKKIDLTLIKFELENRLLLMIISLLCEMLEQFLGGILISNLNIVDGLSFEKIKRLYKKHGYDLEKNSHWDKINELRKLVNVIKHGGGNSEKELRNIRDDYFDDSSVINNTLNDVELNVWPEDLDVYFVEVIGFIDEMPNVIG